MSKGLGRYAVATFGVVLAAVYLLKMLQETLWGPLTREENKSLSDLSGREIVALVPLCVLMLWIGVAPQTFLRPSEPALRAVLDDYKARLAAWQDGLADLATKRRASYVPLSSDVNLNDLVFAELRRRRVVG